MGSACVLGVHWTGLNLFCLGSVVSFRPCIVCLGGNSGLQLCLERETQVPVIMGMPLGINGVSQALIATVGVLRKVLLLFSSMCRDSFTASVSPSAKS